LAALLNGDGRVTMLCGSGCQGAHAQLLALAQCLKAPIVHALKEQSTKKIAPTWLPSISRKRRHIPRMIGILIRNRNS